MENVNNDVVSNNAKYKFNIGDFIEDIDGNVGYIDFICDCEECKKRGFYEPRIHYTSGETDYITIHELEYLEKFYKRIGKYDFTKKTPIINTIDSIIVMGTLDNEHFFKAIISDFDKDKVEIKSNCDNGKKSLALIINGNYSIIV